MAMNPTSSHNVNNFYRAKSHDNTPCRGFYRAKLPYNPLFAGHNARKQIRLLGLLTQC